VVASEATHVGLKELARRRTMSVSTPLRHVLEEFVRREARAQIAWRDGRAGSVPADVEIFCPNASDRRDLFGPAGQEFTSSQALVTRHLRVDRSG
jgi:hypothetical protein